MACRILNAVSGVVIFLLLAGMPDVGWTAPECKGASSAEAKALRKAALESPLHELLEKQSGAASSCRTTSKGGRHTLVLHYPRGGLLELVSSPTAEYVSQHAEFTGKVAAPTPDAALQTLRKLERSAASPDGCAIDWTPLEHAAGSGELKAAGTSCNCKASMTLKDDSVRALSFSMAC